MGVLEPLWHCSTQLFWSISKLRQRMNLNFRYCLSWKDWGSRENLCCKKARNMFTSFMISSKSCTSLRKRPRTKRKRLKLSRSSKIRFLKTMKQCQFMFSSGRTWEWAKGRFAHNVLTQRWDFIRTYWRLMNFSLPSGHLPTLPRLLGKLLAIKIFQI